MCGIAGIFRKNGRVIPEDVSAVRKMMDAQFHRGPDGEGLYQDSRVVLGHRRLAIIDLSITGKQPMSNEDGTVWVSFNGEIYNFRELRDELVGLAHRFRSKSDTEILVHGFEEWGIDGLLDRLRGMFAFAIYDSRDTNFGPKVFLAKDRFGIKPLYFHEGREGFIFGSEVRSLMRTGLIPAETNIKSWVRFLQLGSVPVPLTTEKSISALSAGQYLAIDSTGRKLKTYWKPQDYFGLEASNEVPLSDLKGQIGELLEESIRLHLVSDVPLGVFLSGGIDSSALVALASRFSEKPLATLSVIFKESEYNEASYAKLVSGKYKTDHREIMLGSNDLIDELPLIFSSMDQPTVDGINTYFVSKAAKKVGLKVVLSGIGGDEVFMGYGHYKKAASWGDLLRKISMIPSGIRAALIDVSLLAGKLSSMKGLEKLTYLNISSDAGPYFLFRGLFSPRQVQELLGLGEKELYEFGPPLESFNGYLSERSGPKKQISLCDSFSILEFQGYLQNQLLRDADMMSMAHSIETRVPFLDHQLVELLGGIPGPEKFNKKKNKPLLVNSLGEDLPREIWDRPKMGFTFPFSPWLKESGKRLDGLLPGGGLFESKAVEKTWKGFMDGKIHWSRPWAILVAEKLFESI